MTKTFKKEISYYKASDAKNFKHVKQDMDSLLKSVRKREGLLGNYFYYKFDEPRKFTKDAWRHDVIHIAIDNATIVAFAWAKIFEIRAASPKDSFKIAELVSSGFVAGEANEHVVKTAIDLVAREVKKKGCKYFIAPVYNPGKKERFFFKSLGMAPGGVEYWKKL